jgi:hypothetical protein
MIDVKVTGVLSALRLVLVFTEPEMRKIASVSTINHVKTP